MKIDIRTVVCGAYQENAFVVSAEGRDDCVVVDPGDGLAALRRAVGDQKPAAILLTHGHFDHTLAAPALAAQSGAPVYIHAGDREMLFDAGLNAYDAYVAELPSPAPMPTLDYAPTLDVAGLNFQVLHTPGHSRGSVCLYLPDEGVLFSGDTLFRAGYGRLDLYGGDPDAMADSLRALFLLPGEVRVYSGHGSVTTIALERGRYRL